MSKPPVLTEKKLIAMSPDMVAAIREYRFANRIETESEAIRRLISMGIAAEPILRDILRLIEHLNDPELAKHAKDIKTALGE